MDDLSERQKTKIKEVLKESLKFSLRFNHYGIIPASYPFLDNVVRVLKENPEVRLDLVLNTIKNDIPGNTMEISESWAQELAFYFKNKGINRNAFRVKGFGLSGPVFKSFIPDNNTIDGEIEFIFMKN
jgi:outer membrane protein OmpA-like peptidoglycan-associated protein